MKSATKAPVAKNVTTKELPKSIRPRERMASVGPGKLSNSELIAILLGTGTRGISSLHMAESVLCKFGERVGLLGVADFDELSSLPGVGPAKAAQLLAGIELGKRVIEEKATTKQSLSGPRKVADVLMPKMRHLEREHFFVMVVDAKIRLIRTVEIAIGGLKTAVVDPREVYKAAIRANGAGIIVAHNHPSGEVVPSREDILLTRRLAEAGKILGTDFIDHVIIGDGSWLSLKEAGHF